MRKVARAGKLDAPSAEDQLWPLGLSVIEDLAFLQTGISQALRPVLLLLLRLAAPTTLDWPRFGDKDTWVLICI